MAFFNWIIGFFNSGKRTMKKNTKLGFLVFYYLSLFGVTLLLTLSAGSAEDGGAVVKDSASISALPSHQRLGE
ncbi:MAG: hypothetical protein CMQ15_07010 [Gammaproteobacteria bacterium]|nr:hypothetical protein [Gammaproteobacteria bacterium]